MLNDLLPGRFSLSKLREEDRQAIRELRREKGLRYKVLAGMFDCSTPHIASIINGRIGGNDPPPQVKIEPMPHAMPWATKARLMAGK